MYFKPSEYCKVCANYNLALNHCEKGHEVSFCNGDEFKPSFKTSALNLLSLLYESSMFNKTMLDDIEDFIYNYERKNKNEYWKS